MPHDIWQHMYAQDAAAYERIVQNEDYTGSLLRALQAIYPLDGGRVAELGAGTGRITSLLSGRAGFIAAFDNSPAMLAYAQCMLKAQGRANCGFALGDNRCLPALSGWADLVVEGWSFLHLKVWNETAWMAETDQALLEMLRICRPGGTAVVIETLGTGVKTPAFVPQFLPFFERLEAVWGFQRTWCRTDYHFDAQEQARLALLPAFGEDVLRALEQTPQGWILPECTGLWWRKH
jgi:ubiquinone/menaquinone biosynthesis C-methylase UbiE